MTISPSRTKRSAFSRGQAGDDFREEPVERLLFLGLQLDAIAVAEGEAAEAVIFRLVEPALAERQFVDRLGLHRLRGERDRQRHRRFLGVISWSMRKAIVAITGKEPEWVTRSNRL